MKQLICAKDIQALKEKGKQFCFIDKDTIITPSAKDVAGALGIIFTFEQEEKQLVNNTCCNLEIDSSQIYKALKILMDKGLLDGLFKSYDSENHPNGLKVVRGSTVKMNALKTENPNAKVYFQELVNKKESHMSAGFMEIDHSEFQSELVHEEIDYVIEGTLTVTIDQNTYTIHSGDVLFVPSGSKVVWGSSDKAKVFYATYPAS